MKKKILSIKAAIFFCILVININPSIGQISPGDSSDWLSRINFHPSIYNPLLWPFGSNFLFYPFLYTPAPFWANTTNQMNLPYYSPNINYQITPNIPSSYLSLGGPFLNYTYNLWPQFLSPGISTDNQKQNDEDQSGISTNNQSPNKGEPFVEWVAFNSAPAGSELAMTVIASSMQEVEMDIQVPGMKVRSEVKEGVTYQQVNISGCGSTTQVGKPQLPIISKFVPIPAGASVEAEVIESTFEEIEGYRIYPAQEPIPAIEDAPVPPLMIDEAQYQRDEFYPNEILEIDTPVVMRGCSVVIVRIYPVQFNPVKGTLRIYSHFKVKVSFQGGEDYYVEDRLRSSSFDKTYNRLFGFTAMPSFELHMNEPSFEQHMSEGYDDGKFLLIITPPEFSPAAESLAAWKIKKGIHTQVVTTDSMPASIPGKPTAEEITTSIQQFYDRSDFPLSHLLLIGDAEFIPCHYKTKHFIDDQGFIGTDLYYATLDGADYFPDISLGRLSVDTLAQANKRVTDIIRYEKALVFNEDYYTQAACASHFQDNDNNQVEDLRFVLTTEDIQNYLTDHGFDVDRIYGAYDMVNPKYWGDFTWHWPYPSLILEERELPLELQRPNFAWQEDGNDISSAVNSGRFLVVHDGHGSRFGWGSPPYSTYQVDVLENGDKLPVVWSINCMTGWFDNETDDFSSTSFHSVHFSESWERNPKGGAIGLIASTRISYCIHNDLLIWGWMDAIWPDFNPDYTPLDTYFDDGQYEMGQVLNYGKLYYASLHEESKIRQLNFEIYHWFGDPTMQIWTAMPKTLDVSHQLVTDEGATFIDITVSEPGALICISKEGQILSRTISNAGTNTLFWPESLQPGEVIDITITKHNFRPYEGTVTCTPLRFDLTLTQDALIVAQGGTLGYQVTVTNNINTAHRVIFATDVNLPDGSRYPQEKGSYINGPSEVWFEPNQSITAHLTLSLPGDEPEGVYTWHAYILDEGGNCIAKDEFLFEIKAEPVSVSLTPPMGKLVAQGGILEYTATVTNHTNEVQNIRYAMDVVLPDGSRYPSASDEYLIGPTDLTYLPNQSITASLTFDLPGNEPLGTYLWRVFIFDEFRKVIAEDEFAFKITASIPEVSVMMMPDVRSIIPGGTLGYWATVTNHTESLQIVSFATNITLLDGQRYPAPGAGYLDGPIELNLSPYQSISGHLTFSFPDYVLPGVYTWHAYSLNTLGQVIDHDDFSLNITPEVPLAVPYLFSTFNDVEFQSISGVSISWGN